MPDPASVHVKCAVTGPLFQPFAFGAGVSETVIVGGPRSMLKASLVTAAVLPALSVAEPLTV